MKEAKKPYGYQGVRMSHLMHRISSPQSFRHRPNSLIEALMQPRVNFVTFSSSDYVLDLPACFNVHFKIPLYIRIEIQA